MLRRKHHLAMALGGAAALLLAALGAFGFVKSGLYNVAASHPHTAFTEWLTHDTMIHSVKSHAAGVSAPAGFTPDQVFRGFCHYAAHCVACHGAAGVARQQWANGLEPQPPYLLDATQRWKPQDLFWIVKHGIKMTAMPSWGDSMPDQQIWDVVGYLEASRVMPPQTFAQWRASRSCPPQP